MILFLMDFREARFRWISVRGATSVWVNLLHGLREALV